MKAPRGCMAVLVVVLATGCLEKPAPWVPGNGFLPDAAADAETVTGDGLVTADLADVGGDKLPADTEVRGQELLDGDGGPDDKTAPDEWDAVDSEVLLDAELPEVTTGAPMLVPGVFSGVSTGGQFTLYPVGAPLVGALMTGGNWHVGAAPRGRPGGDM